MKILYLDCGAGIAGDMMVAGLLALGLPLEHLRQELARLPLSGYAIDAQPCMRQGMAATHFQVTVAVDQPHRHYTDIAAMIDASSLANGVKARAQVVFRRLAEAEAKVHGVEVDQVHFHEVGAIDSIVYIVGAAIGLEYLGVEALQAAPLPWGSGYVESAHGRLPVPAPATAELLTGLPVHGDIGPGERVTPTGAALVAALATHVGPMPAMTVTAIGCGAGTKDFPDRPNILRLVLGEVVSRDGYDEIQVLETHMDDMSPEIGGWLMERLLAAGALDVAFAPLQMKKNRPATRLTIISPMDKVDELARLVLAESTAIGVRYYPVSRMILSRAVEERDTSLGRVKVKAVRDGERLLRIVPEFEECRRLAGEKGLPLMEVYRIIERESEGR